MLKKVVITTGVGFVVLIAAVSIAFASMAARFEKRVKSLTISNVDIAKVRDGRYEGVCDLGPVVARVSVIVEKGRITGISLVKHSHGPGRSAEAILQRIIDAQSLDVDAIAGSTYSSKTIRKAAELALTSEPN